MNIFGSDLRDRIMKIICYEKKEMIPLINEEKKIYIDKKKKKKKKKKRHGSLSLSWELQKSCS